MRYIKTFEELDEINLKYDVGDYVILDMDKIKKEEWCSDGKLPIDNIVYIKSFRELGPNQYYHIEFYNGMDDDFYLIRDEDILRKATQKEINEFNLKIEISKHTDKYNI